MLIEKTIGVLHEPAFADKSVDYVDIEWHEAFKRLHRKTSSQGREIAMRFSDDILVHGLNQDDVLAVDGDSVIAVNMLPCPILVIETKYHHQIAKACYEIGNKHAPLFFGENSGEFITPYDKTIEVLMHKLHIETRTESAKLNFKMSISSGGAHQHSH